MPLNLRPEDFANLLLGGGQQQAMPTEDPEMAAIRQKLAELQQISSTPAPGAVEPQKINPAQRIALALADALSAHASGLNPGIQPLNALESLRSRREQRAGEQTKAEQEGFRQTQEGRKARVGAEAELLLQERQRKQGEQGKAEDREFKTRQDALDRVAREQESQAELAGREKIAARSADVDREIAGIRSGDERAERAMRERLANLEHGADDPVSKRQQDKEQREAGAFVRQSLPALKAAAKSMKDPDGNPLTPADVRELFEDTLAAQGITDEAVLRELHDLFEKMVEPLLSSQEQGQAKLEQEKNAKAREGVENAARRKKAQEDFQLRQAQNPNVGPKF